MKQKYCWLLMCLSTVVALGYECAALATPLPVVIPVCDKKCIIRFGPYVGPEGYVERCFVYSHITCTSCRGYTSSYMCEVQENTGTNCEEIWTAPFFDPLGNYVPPSPVMIDKDYYVHASGEPCNEHCPKFGQNKYEARPKTGAIIDTDLRETLVKEECR